MTAAMQLDLLGSAPADAEKDAILDLIAGDPIHARDRAAIVEAITASVDDTGHTNSNRWRPLIPAWVYPRCVGAVVQSLIKAHVLVPTDEWVRSDDLKGRNGGKPQMTYEWKGAH